MAEVQVVVAAGWDKKLYASTALRTRLGVGAHQVVINDAYLQGWHALQVQFSLGARHTGLSRVGRKRHPVITDDAGMRESVPYVCACFIRRRCLHGKGISGSAPAQPLVSCWPAVWLKRRAPWPDARLPLAWGHLPRGPCSYCFMVFPLITLLARRTLVHSTGPLSRGMPEQNSPLKMLPKPWPHWYLAPVYGMIEATMEVTFKSDILALTIGYNHMELLELCPAHGQPVQLPMLIALVCP